MKALIFTDLHLGIHNNDERWLDASKSLFKEMLNYAKNNKIKTIIFLGDFFHNRQTISSKALWVSNEIAELVEKSKIDLYLCIGNHDTYYKNSLKPHSLKFLEQYKNIHIVEEPIVLNNNITLTSWNHYIKDINTPYILGHFEISGNYFGNNANIQGADSMTIKEFNKFKLVLSGHFHSISQYKNIFYIGSVMPFSFSDTGQKRGYYEFDFIDDSNYTFHFIEFSDCPKYVIINSTDELLEEKIKGNIVKVIFNNEVNSEAEKIIEKIHKLNPLMVQAEFLQLGNNSEVKREDVEVKTPRDLLFEYIDNIEIPNNISTNILTKIINQIIE